MSKRSSRKKDEPLVRPPASPRIWGSVLAIAVLGAAISAYLTYVHYQIQADAGWQSLCDVSAQFSCGAVAASDYSSIGGVPIAWFGVVFYAVVSWLAWRALRGGDFAIPRSPPLLLVAAGAVASTLSIALALVSALLIEAFCPLCVVLYACNAGFLALGIVDLRRCEESLGELLRAERRTLRRNANAVASVLLAALVPLGALPLYSSMRPPLQDFCGYLEGKQAGRDGAKTTLVLYTDYQCPFCKRADATLDHVRSRPGVSLSVRNYPLDRDCNPKLQRTIHPGACLQASAAICAELAGRGREFGRQIFETAAKERASLTRLAKDIGMDAVAFEACLGSEATAKRLAADIDAAGDDGVRGTPALFIDGRPFKGRIEPATFECKPRR